MFEYICIHAIWAGCITACAWFAASYAKHREDKKAEIARTEVDERLLLERRTTPHGTNYPQHSP